MYDLFWMKDDFTMYTLIICFNLLKTSPEYTPPGVYGKQFDAFYFIQRVTITHACDLTVNSLPHFDVSIIIMFYDMNKVNWNESEMTSHTSWLIIILMYDDTQRLHSM